MRRVRVDHGAGGDGMSLSSFLGLFLPICRTCGTRRMWRCRRASSIYVREYCINCRREARRRDRKRMDDDYQRDRRRSDREEGWE